MYYLIVSVILLSFVYFLEVKKKSLSSKFKDIVSFKSSINKDFNLCKIISMGIFFSMFAACVILLLEKFDLIIINGQQFSISLIFEMIYSITTVPIVEEYFYRFIPYSFIKFDNKLKYIVVIFLSSLLFAYFHSVGVFPSVFIFCLAIVLSLIYLKTGNILYTIICHTFYNLVINLMTYFDFKNIIVFILLLVISFLVICGVYIKKRK